MITVESLMRDIERLNKRLEFEYERGYTRGFQEGYSKGIETLIEYEKIRTDTKYIVVTQDKFNEIKSKGL